MILILKSKWKKCLIKFLANQKSKIELFFKDTVLVAFSFQKINFVTIGEFCYGSCSLSCCFDLHFERLLLLSLGRLLCFRLSHVEEIFLNNSSSFFHHLNGLPLPMLSSLPGFPLPYVELISELRQAQKHKHSLYLRKSFFGVNF